MASRPEPERTNGSDQRAGCTFSLLWLLLPISGVVLLGSCVVYLKHWWNEQHVVAPSDWPSQLKEILADLRSEGIEPSDVEVRHVGFITTYCWRMPATDRTVAAHIERFNLEPVPNNGIEVQRIRENFPPAWPWPDQKNIECCAYPPGLPGAQDGEFEFVLIRDRASSELFFYYYFNF